MKIAIIKLGKGEWQFHIVARNGKVLCTSAQTYTRRRNAVETAATIRDGLGRAGIEDQE